MFVTLLCAFCVATAAGSVPVAGAAGDGVIVGLGTGPPASASVPLFQGSRPRIAAVEIDARDVFDDLHVDGPVAAAYRVVNRVHVRTRAGVVRRELLFAEGDLLDPELLAQTERNLRALPFLREARVETAPTGEVDEHGSPLVAVRVTTWDTWSTAPELRLVKVGDRLLWSAGLSETNFLGRGKKVFVSRRTELDRAETWLELGDRQLFGSRFVLETSYADRTDGDYALVALKRPFFSADETWSGGFRFEAFDQLDPLYRDGRLTDRLRHVRRWLDVELSRALSHDSHEAWRLDLALRSRKDEVAGELRDFGIVEVGISSIENDFIELTHVNRFELTEDFNLGRQFAAALGISTPWLGGEDGTAYFFSLFHKQGLRLGAEHFVTGSVGWKARHRRGELEDSLLEARLAWLKKHSERHVALASARLRLGHDLDPERQIALGVDAGLRGYPVRQWVGDRSLLVTAEERWALVDDLAQLVSVGLAAFVDSGAAWATGESIALGDLRTDVGIGVLLGRNRFAASQPTVRLDLAYALDPVDGHSRWLFSSGSSIDF